MKKILLHISIILITLLCSRPLYAQMRNDGGAPFAVVELFTSEGCSSCPSADALLIELTEQAHKEGARIFPLGFHVDYWDYLGWKDRFSSGEYSGRQRQYAAALRTSSVYTPQMIVNGTYQFIGSNRAQAQQWIKESLKADSAVNLSLEQKSEKPNSIIVHFKSSRAVDNAVINFALVERDLANSVSRGENSGRTLRHHNVVRAFKSLPLSEQEGDTVLTFPDDVKLENASIIGFIQDNKNMNILGANFIDL